MIGATMREAPRWVVVATILIVVVGVVYFGALAITGREGAPGPDK
jgi:hypothetical protein